MPSFLTSAERDKLPDTDFALPGRRYPIHDHNHAVAALSRVAANGTSAEQSIVRAKVKLRYPTLAMDAGMPRKD